MTTSISSFTVSTSAQADRALTESGSAFTRCLVLTASAAVLVGGALVGQTAAAPPARADRIVSAHDICSAEGLVPKVRYFPPPVVGVLHSLVQPIPW